MFLYGFGSKSYTGEGKAAGAGAGKKTLKVWLRVRAGPVRYRFTIASAGIVKIDSW